MRERTHLEQSLKEYHGIESELEDAVTLAELGEAEGDEASIDVGGGTRLSVTIRSIAEKLGDTEE